MKVEEESDSSMASLVVEEKVVVESGNNMASLVVEVVKDSGMEETPVGTSWVVEVMSTSSYELKFETASLETLLPIQESMWQRPLETPLFL
ncbi:hypothetical protein P7M08_23890, partial [Vibrio parahaemolyticus]|nr:hypothetical protein [Vibrio parahaemolyticus]NMR88964.1 hypothetical protein [Vibrio parahaemolyticus]